MFYNRRHILAASGLSLGGLLFGSGLTFAGTDTELSALVKSIIHEHYPQASEQEAVVDQFVKDLLQQKMDNLEPRNFLQQEARKADKTDLQRYVLVQFMTSPGFIAIQKK